MCEIVDNIIEQVKQFMDCKHKLPLSICVSKIQFLAWLTEKSKKGNIYFDYNGERYPLPQCKL